MHHKSVPVSPLRGERGCLCRVGEEIVSEQPPTEYAPPGWFPDPTGLQDQRWWDGRQWGHQTRPQPGTGQASQPLFPPQAYGQQPPQPSFTSDPQHGASPGQPPYRDQRQPGPPSGDRGRPARRSWPQRHKVLTVLGSLTALIIVIGGIASISGKAKEADNASAVTITTPTRTTTPSPPSTHHATSTETVPTVTAQATTLAPVATTPSASGNHPGTRGDHPGTRGGRRSTTHGDHPHRAATFSGHFTRGLSAAERRKHLLRTRRILP